jgi:hypothetical protein
MPFMLRRFYTGRYNDKNFIFPLSCLSKKHFLGKEGSKKVQKTEEKKCRTDKVATTEKRLHQIFPGHIPMKLNWLIRLAQIQVIHLYYHLNAPHEQEKNFELGSGGILQVLIEKYNYMKATFSLQM